MSGHHAPAGATDDVMDRFSGFIRLLCAPSPRERVNRRSEPRGATGVPCVFVSEDQTVSGVIENVSETGLQVRFSGLTAGLSSLCVVRLIHKSSPFALMCRIMWRRPVRRRRDLLVGLQISDPPAWSRRAGMHEAANRLAIAR